MQSAQIFTELRQYVARQMLEGQDDGLDEATPLLELGVLDSVSLVSLVAFVEQRFDIHIPGGELGPHNFKDLRSITALIERLRREQT
jgi:acyl carrier protein